MPKLSCRREPGHDGRAEEIRIAVAQAGQRDDFRCHDLFGDGLFFEGQTSSAAVLEAPAEPDPALREFAEAVAGLDVDSLTPREALAKLYEIREEAVKAAKGI